MFTIKLMHAQIISHSGRYKDWKIDRLSLRMGLLAIIVYVNYLI